MCELASLNLGLNTKFCGCSTAREHSPFTKFSRASVSGTCSRVHALAVFRSGRTPGRILITSRRRDDEFSSVMLLFFVPLYTTGVWYRRLAWLHFREPCSREALESYVSRVRAKPRFCFLSRARDHALPSPLLHSPLSLPLSSATQEIANW